MPNTVRCKRNGRERKQKKMKMKKENARESRYPCGSHRACVRIIYTPLNGTARIVV